MANLVVIFTLLFSVFVLSHARNLLTQPSNLVAEYTPSIDKEITSNLDAEHTPSIDKEIKTNLPSRDISETGFIKVFDLPVSESPDTLARIGTVRPFTVTYVISLHPINRHFQGVNVNDPFMYKFPHRRHRCHHHGKKSVGPHEISYGNDMIMSHESEANTGELTEESKEEVHVVHGKYLEKEREEGGGGFFNRVRKFLDQF